MSAYSDTAPNASATSPESQVLMQVREQYNNALAYCHKHVHDTWKAINIITLDPGSILL